MIRVFKNLWVKVVLLVTTLIYTAAVTYTYLVSAALEGELNSLLKGTKIFPIDDYNLQVVIEELVVSKKSPFMLSPGIKISPFTLKLISTDKFFKDPLYTLKVSNSSVIAKSLFSNKLSVNYSGDLQLIRLDKHSLIKSNVDNTKLVLEFDKAIDLGNMKSVSYLTDNLSVSNDEGHIFSVDKIYYDVGLNDNLKQFIKKLIQTEKIDHDLITKEWLAQSRIEINQLLFTEQFIKQIDLLLDNIVDKSFLDNIYDHSIKTFLRSSPIDLYMSVGLQQIFNDNNQDLNLIFNLSYNDLMQNFKLRSSESYSITKELLEDIISNLQNNLDYSFSADNFKINYDSTMTFKQNYWQESKRSIKEVLELIKDKELSKAELQDALRALSVEKENIFSSILLETIRFMSEQDLYLIQRYVNYLNIDLDKFFNIAYFNISLNSKSQDGRLDYVYNIDLNGNKILMKSKIENSSSITNISVKELPALKSMIIDLLVDYSNFLSSIDSSEYEKYNLDSIKHMIMTKEQITDLVERFAKLFSSKSGLYHNLEFKHNGLDSIKFLVNPEDYEELSQLFCDYPFILSKKST